MKKYNLSNIMKKAWELFRKAFLKIKTFGEALHRAWEIAKCADGNSEKIEKAKAESGVTERVRTHFGWTTEGREVKHGSKCLFQVTVSDPSRGDGKTKVLSYFGESRTEAVVAE